MKFFWNGQIRGDLGPSIEETFRRVDLGPRDLVCLRGAYVSPEVEFLLTKGARLEDVPRGINKLLEDTFRYIDLGPWKHKRRADVCFSPEVYVLIQHGATFEEVPCGLKQLARDIATYIRQSDENTIKFLRQNERFSRKEWLECEEGFYDYNGGRSKLLYEVELELGLFLPCTQSNDTLFHMVETISSHEEVIKVYNAEKFEQDGVRWPLVTYGEVYTSKSGYITELLERSPKVNIVAEEGGLIPVSRMLLRARSPYFKDLIGRDSMERSYEVKLPYKATRFAVEYIQTEYIQTEPNGASWTHFKPCSDRDSTEDILDELIDILYVADEFRMVDLHGRAQRQIIEHGVGFIDAINAREIKQIAKEANAAFVDRYCAAFIELNGSFTCFLRLPVELQDTIWHYAAFQPQVLCVEEPDCIKQTTSHVAGLLGACKVSRSIFQQQFHKNLTPWGKDMPIAYFNPKVDIAWFGGIFSILWPDLQIEDMAEVKKAQYCACAAPGSGGGDDEWEFVSRLVDHCRELKILYFTADIRVDDDILEYCRGFTNRDPKTLIKARNMIEERAHQLIKQKLTQERVLPKIVMGSRMKLNDKWCLSLMPNSVLFYKDCGM